MYTEICNYIVFIHMSIKYKFTDDSVIITNKTIKNSLLVENNKYFYFLLADIFDTSYMSLIVYWPKTINDNLILGFKIIDANLISPLFSSKICNNEKVYVLAEVKIPANLVEIDTELIFDNIMFNLYKLRELRLIVDFEFLSTFEKDIPKERTLKKKCNEYEITYFPIKNSKDCIYSIMSSICTLLSSRNRINKTWFKNYKLVNYEWKRKYFN